MNGVFIVSNPTEKTFDAMNQATNEWTAKAARGECAWICADCSMTFTGGMPDECEYGHISCTKIIQRDKAAAKDQP